MIGLEFPETLLLSHFPFRIYLLLNWGDGSITVEGQGSVTDPVVIYSYRIDECYDEQSNPACPGYVKPIPVIPVVELYDVLEDEAAMAAIDEDTDFQYDEDGNLILSEEEEEEET